MLKSGHFLEIPNITILIILEVIVQILYHNAYMLEVIKWIIQNGNNKSPSWSGVEFLYQFLINNKSVGPFGDKVDQTKIEIGDIAQLSFDGQKFSHTLIIVNIKNKYTLSGIKIASHTLDSYNKAISEYNFEQVRFIHIKGVN